MAIQDSLQTVEFGIPAHEVIPVPLHLKPSCSHKIRVME